MLGEAGICRAGCTSGGSAKYPFNLEASAAQEGRLRLDQRGAGLFSLRIRAQAPGIANPHGIPPAILSPPPPLPAPLIKSADRMFTKGFPEIPERVGRHPPVRPFFAYSLLILLWDIHYPVELTRAANSWICWLSRNSASAADRDENASSFPHGCKNY